jgi:hypothetical protein
MSPSSLEERYSYPSHWTDEKMTWKLSRLQQNLVVLAQQKQRLI